MCTWAREGYTPKVKRIPTVTAHGGQWSINTAFALDGGIQGHGMRRICPHRLAGMFPRVRMPVRVGASSHGHFHIAVALYHHMGRDRAKVVISAVTWHCSFITLPNSFTVKHDGPFNRPAVTK